MKEIPTLHLNTTLKNEKITEISLSIDAKNKPENPLILKEIEDAWLNNKKPLPMQCDLTTMKPFQKKVLLTLRDTRPGDLLTYSELAKKAGYPKAARAVGTVLSTNPYLLLFPCHRVIRKDGSLGSFSAGKTREEGIAIKKILIAFEKTVVN